MPILRNPRHEVFAQELAKGLSIADAYEAAGYKPCRKNASHLLQDNALVRARVAELQAAGAERTEMTIESLTENLLRIAERAEDEQTPAGLNVARAALMDVAKLNGLLIEKSVNVNTTYVVDNKPATEDEWAEEYASAAIQ